MLKYDRAAKDSEKVSGYNVANKADEAALYFLVLRDHISPRAICLFQMKLFTLLFFLFSFSFLFLLSSQFPLCSKTTISFFFLFPFNEKLLLPQQHPSYSSIRALFPQWNFNFLLIPLGGLNSWISRGGDSPPSSIFSYLTSETERPIKYSSNHFFANLGTFKLC